MDKLPEALNKQLKKYHVSIKQGALVGASVVETPFTPKGPLTIEVAEDREDTRSEEEKGAEEKYQKSVTSQGKGTPHALLTRKTPPKVAQETEKTLFF